MSGKQIKESLNLISMQMNGLRGAGEFGKFGAEMFRTVSQEWQKAEKKKNNKKKSTDINKKDLKGKGKKNDRKKSETEKNGTFQETSRAMVAGNIATAPDTRNKNGRRTSENTLRVNGKQLSEKRLQEAFVWAEILGEPMAHKRRTRRVNQRYGNQSNADRR